MIDQTIQTRFCFYTSSGTETGTTVGLGDDGGLLCIGDSVTGGGKDPIATTVTVAVPDDVLQRSHSTSSIQDILRESHRTMFPIECSESPLKSRSSSCDDLVSLSGSPTPTLTPTKAQFKL